MRIVIVDLHCNGFMLRTFENIANRRRVIAKHGFFLEEAIKNGYDVIDYVTGTRSDLWIGKKSLLLNRWEAAFVIWKNGLKGKVSCIADTRMIRGDDLVIFYPHLNASFDLFAIQGHKYANVNHFFSISSTDQGIDWAAFLKPDGFEGYICEADVLHDSPFFRKYLPIEDKRLLLLPYVAGEKFKIKKEFRTRKNKAVALGSHGIKYEMYKEIYGTEWLHPMRKELLDRMGENEDQIDCEIGVLQPSKPYFTIAPHEGKIKKGLKRIYNHFYCAVNSPFREKGKNAGYYNKDIVELFNGYKMFIFPEEITGLPALGFVEGMSCGCAYIGLDSPMYTKLGMKPGKHYIGYDGTYDDLIKKISYYQEHEKELEQIAENGYRFVKENLSSKVVFQRFIEQFEDQKDKDVK